MNVICDLDGVVYLGQEAIPGAGEALTSLAGAGYNLLFATNNSTRTAEEGAAKISRLTGYQAEPGQLVSSAEAAVRLLASDPMPVYLFGAAGAAGWLRAAGIDVVEDPLAAGAVIAGLDEDLTYRKLAAAVEAVCNGARFIATNVDATYPTPRGLWPGAGALVAAVVAATGRLPEVAGKPQAPMVELIRSRLEPGPVIVVGDRSETDIALGLAGGWQTCLVLTGVATAADERFPPDHVVADITEAAGYILSSSQDQ